MSSQDMTILITSCKKYSDVLHVFEQLFIRYWEDCPYDIVLSTDFNAEQPYLLDYANVIASGSIPNGTRNYYALQTITTPYVLWLPEDFWLTNNVSNGEISRFLEYAKKYDAGHLRLSKFSWENDDVFDNNNELFAVGQGAYRVIYGGIWETRFLIPLLEKYDNAWEFERKASYDSIVCDRLVLAARRYTFPVVPVVWRGRLIRESVGIMKAHGIDPDSMNRRVESTWEFYREKFKGAIFNLSPNLVTKTLNALGLGHKRKR